MVRPGVQTDDVRQVYLVEVQDRIDRWSGLSRRLRMQAMSKDPATRARIETDLAIAEKHLEELRSRTATLKAAVGQTWHETARNIGRLWDSFQAAFESARARL